MNTRTTLPNEEQPVDPEAQQRLDSILHGVSAGDTTSVEQPAPEPRTRATRKDKGEPRVYVEIPGVRFDLLTEEGREAYKSWMFGCMRNEVGFTTILNSVTQLLAHIDRLAARAKE